MSDQEFENMFMKFVFDGLIREAWYKFSNQNEKLCRWKEFKNKHLEDNRGNKKVKQ